MGNPVLSSIMLAYDALWEFADLFESYRGYSEYSKLSCLSFISLSPILKSFQIQEMLEHIPEFGGHGIQRINLVELEI